MSRTFARAPAPFRYRPRPRATADGGAVRVRERIANCVLAGIYWLTDEPEQLQLLEPAEDGELSVPRPLVY